MTADITDLKRGREAFETQSWELAHDALTAAREAGELAPPDLWRLALSAYLLGLAEDFVDAAQEAYKGYLRREAGPEAARCAFWVGFHLANRGDMAQASGWFGRAGRLLDEIGGEYPERGYLLIPASYRRFVEGAYEDSADIAGRALHIGRDFGEADLVALALHLQGRARLRQARIDEGLALLDEAMVDVSTGELSPQTTGLIYCSVIGACREVQALGRAHEWTAALSEWCEAQPDMVAYTGECRVYRAEILRLRGKWRDAMNEARRASDRFAKGSVPSSTGAALYQQGEIHRLRGAFAAAEEAYKAASLEGREPQPGLALLRLAQGESEVAVASIRRALAGTSEARRRAALLPAAIEILLDAGDVAEARRAHDELREVAAVCARGMMDATVLQMEGAIALEAGDASEALAPLRRAWKAWRSIDAPYEAARTREMVASACLEMGDQDTAAMEMEAARVTFERLGAAPDLARLDSFARRRRPAPRHGLTSREVEVLTLVATGRTNRAIGEELSISEKTVARHLANIFTKLDVSSRTAATAYAYEHGLLEPST